jgi:arylsulfatase A-like enzyme
MPAGEITVAELLRDAGYATGGIGKWDVSNRAAILNRMPNAQGFDHYYGTLGANDNGRVAFHENNKRVGQTADMASLTRIYTDKSIEFLKRNKDKPFFLYLAHTMVHSVLDFGSIHERAIARFDDEILDTAQAIGVELRNL